VLHFQTDLRRTLRLPGQKFQKISANASRPLADILAPLMGKTDHHVKNSQEFATEMASILVDEGECFVSHDVVSLVANTPISEALEIIRNQLENDKRLKDRTNLEIDDIMELLEFVVTTTYFALRGVIYQ